MKYNICHSYILTVKDETTKLKDDLSKKDQEILDLQEQMKQMEEDKDAEAVRLRSEVRNVPYF